MILATLAEIDDKLPREPKAASYPEPGIPSRIVFEDFVFMIAKVGNDLSSVHLDDYSKIVAAKCKRELQGHMSRLMKNDPTLQQVVN